MVEKSSNGADGDYSLWPIFRDGFMVLIHARPSLLKIDKIYYLFGCLYESALDVIREIPVSADNYN